MGNQRDKPQTTKNTEYVKSIKLTYAVSSMCGWRAYMQDAHLAICPFDNDQHLALFAVFDGHGGSQCAMFAKDHFPTCLQNNQNFRNKNYELALIQTFLQIDHKMQSNAGKKILKSIRQHRAKQNQGNDYEGDSIAGTTANVCLITKNEVYVANAGDSRCIGFIRQNKTNIRIKQLSRDHKPGNQNQKKRILKAGGSINEEGRINQNLNLSRALGDFSYKDNKDLKQEQQIVIASPEVNKANLKQVSYIIMGCDGIWQKKSNLQMAKWITNKLEKGKNLKQIIEALLSQELGKSPEDQFGMDNMTAIIIHIP